MPDHNGGGRLQLVSVNVGQPKVLGRRDGEDVWSSIAKEPVSASQLELTTLNLAGDAQADVRVHGGPDKAVYAYPADHFPWWSALLNRAVGPGAFGENLTVAGTTEAAVGIGDRWFWGDAVLEVAQPRSPCYKLALHAGTSEVGRAMNGNGFTGWYLRVLAPGTVPAIGTISVEPHPARVSVVDAHFGLYARPPSEELMARLMDHDRLAGAWHSALTARLARVRAR
jgi:MOSC domain-containing protein YiiM